MYKGISEIWKANSQVKDLNLGRQVHLQQQLQFRHENFIGCCRCILCRIRLTVRKKLQVWLKAMDYLWDLFFSLGFLSVSSKFSSNYSINILIPANFPLIKSLLKLLSWYHLKLHHRITPKCHSNSLTLCVKRNVRLQENLTGAWSIEYIACCTWK